MANIKGSVLRLTFDLIKETHGTDWLAEALALATPADRTLLDAASVSGWYPLDFFARWLDICLEVACGGNKATLVERAAVGLEHQLRGIYRVFALLSSPEAVLKKLSAIHSAYFDGITYDLHEKHPKEYRITYKGFDKKHALLECVILGWWRKILQTTKAQKPEVEVVNSVASGKGDIEISLRWQ